jgi:hypothetical protein
MATAKDISANNKIDIVKDNRVIAKIEQPLTNVISINAPGPIGPSRSNRSFRVWISYLHNC